jgi:hypothetical protein
VLVAADRGLARLSHRVRPEAHQLQAPCRRQVDRRKHCRRQVGRRSRLQVRRQLPVRSQGLHGSGTVHRVVRRSRVGPCQILGAVRQCQQAADLGSCGPDRWGRLEQADACRAGGVLGDPSSSVGARPEAVGSVDRSLRSVGVRRLRHCQRAESRLPGSEASLRDRECQGRPDDLRVQLGSHLAAVARQEAQTVRRAADDANREHPGGRHPRVPCPVRQRRARVSRPILAPVVAPARCLGPAPGVDRRFPAQLTEEQTPREGDRWGAVPAVPARQAHWPNGSRQGDAPALLRAYRELPTVGHLCQCSRQSAPRRRHQYSVLMLVRSGARAREARCLAPPQVA